MKNEYDNGTSILGLIFDLDGTLIKSVVNFPKMKRKMIEYIKGLDLPKIMYTIEQTTNEIILDLNDKMISNKIPEVKRNEIFNSISEILTKVEFENVKKVRLLPGVDQLLSYCQNVNINMGILTRASREYTLKCLEITGINTYFDAVFTRDDFTLLRAKPHPLALNTIIEELSVDPKNLLFIGDHKIDFMCAQNGDIRFVGVLSGAYDPKKLQQLGCWKVVKDFFELAKLIKEINN
jgi:phosphoglycolate phosphatase-like HAD superfamily hydrolase